MKMILKNIFLLLLAQSLLVAEFAFSDQFKVALPIIEPFNPISNNINSLNYIGLHLYYPLFTTDSDGNMSSKFLDMSKTLALTKKFNEYQFCLRNDVMFSDNTKIISADLYESLKFLFKIHPELFETPKIYNLNSQCIKLKFNKPTPNLFKKLTGITSTVLKSAYVDKLLPIGFGPYKLKQKTENSILLTSTLTNKPRFEEIEFRLINASNILRTDNFQDLNQVPPIDRPNTGQQNINQYQIPSLKVYAIVINLNNKHQRNCIQNALNKLNIVDLYKLPLLRQKSFLPWRIDVEYTYKITNCNLKNDNIPYLVADIYDSGAIKKTLAKLNGSEVFKVHSLPANEFAKWVFSGKPYVAMISFDSASSASSIDSNYTLYFESFITKQKKILSNPITKLIPIIAEATRYDISIHDRENIIKNAEKLLISEGWVLPIGRLNLRFSFPKDISIETWVDKLNGYPAIWKIE